VLFLWPAVAPGLWPPCPPPPPLCYVAGTDAGCPPGTKCIFQAQVYTDLAAALTIWMDGAPVVDADGLVVRAGVSSRGFLGRGEVQIGACVGRDPRVGHKACVSGVSPRPCCCATCFRYLHVSCTRPATLDCTGDQDGVLGGGDVGVGCCTGTPCMSIEALTFGVLLPGCRRPCRMWRPALLLCHPWPPSKPTCVSAHCVLRGRKRFPANACQPDHWYRC
jgi:hypothetical protein